MGYNNFLGVLEILMGSFKILPRNGNCFALIATLGVLLHSLSFFVNRLFLKPSFFINIIESEKSTNLATKNLIRSESADLFRGLQIEDYSIIPGINVAFILVYIPIAIFINTLIVYASAMSLHGHSLSISDLLVRLSRSFMRVFITSSLVITRLVYWGIVLWLIPSAILIVIMLIIPEDYSNALKVLFTSAPDLYSIYLLYATVVWALAFVISVMEENCYGIEILRKAEGLVKGRRFDGIVINIVLNIFMLIISKLNQIMATKWPSKEIVTGLFMTSISYLGTLFLFVAYTLLYFKWKESHGEDIGLGGNFRYNKVPTMPLLDEETK